MADIFDEVNEDLRAERARQFAMRYGGLILGALLLVLVGVGAWQAWRWKQTRDGDAVAATFLAAMRATTPAAPGVPVADTPERAGALASFNQLASTAPDGYRSLARLRAAALRAAANDLPGALALWDQLSADTQADPLLRDLASLLWVYNMVDSGDPAAVEGRLAPLVAAGNPWRPMALEAQAWLNIRTGAPDKARATLQALLTDPAAPDGVKGRANGLLARLNVTTQPAPPAPTPAPAPGAGG